MPDMSHMRRFTTVSGNGYVSRAFLVYEFTLLYGYEGRTSLPTAWLDETWRR